MFGRGLETRLMQHALDDNRIPVLLGSYRYRRKFVIAQTKEEIADREMGIFEAVIYRYCYRKCQDVHRAVVAGNIDLMHVDFYETKSLNNTNCLPQEDARELERTLGMELAVYPELRYNAVWDGEKYHGVYGNEYSAVRQIYIIDRFTMHWITSR